MLTELDDEELEDELLELLEDEEPEDELLELLDDEEPEDDELLDVFVVVVGVTHLQVLRHQAVK